MATIGSANSMRFNSIYFFLSFFASLHEEDVSRVKWLYGEYIRIWMHSFILYQIWLNVHDKQNRIKFSLIFIEFTWNVPPLLLLFCLSHTQPPIIHIDWYIAMKVTIELKSITYIKTVHVSLKHVTRIFYPWNRSHSISSLLLNGCCLCWFCCSFGSFQCMNPSFKHH